MLAQEMRHVTAQAVCLGTAAVTPSPRELNGLLKPKVQVSAQPGRTLSSTPTTVSTGRSRLPTSSEGLAA